MPETSAVPIDAAVLKTLQTEKNAMDFYRTCARHMQDAKAIKLFQLLAREEREHAASFFRAYPRHDIPDFNAWVDREPQQAEGWLAEIGRDLAGLDERRAMQVALDKEQKLEEHLRSMAASISNPEVRAVYEENARSTHHHYELIEAEYARLMGMVHDTDIDIYVRE